MTTSPVPRKYGWEIWVDFYTSTTSPVPRWYGKSGEWSTQAQHPLYQEGMEKVGSCLHKHSIPCIKKVWKS